MPDEPSRDVMRRFELNQVFRVSVASGLSRRERVDHGSAFQDMPQQLEVYLPLTPVGRPDAGGAPMGPPSRPCRNVDRDR